VPVLPAANWATFACTPVPLVTTPCIICRIVSATFCGSTRSVFSLLFSVRPPIFTWVKATGPRGDAANEPDTRLPWLAIVE